MAKTIVRARAPLSDFDPELVTLRLALPQRIDLRIGVFGLEGAGITGLFQRQFDQTYREKYEDASRINHRTTLENMLVERGDERETAEIHLAFLAMRDGPIKGYQGVMLAYDMNDRVAFEQLAEQLAKIRE